MALKYKVGDKVRIKSIDWYNKNKTKRGNISFPYEAEVAFTLEMSSLCGQIVTISQKGYTQDVGFYRIREDNGVHLWTDEMIEGLVEEETKPKFKIGDRVIVRGMSGIWEITNAEDDILYTIKRENYTFTLTTYGSFLTLYESISDKKEEMKLEDELLDEYEELTDRAFKGGYEKCQSDIILNGYTLPDGYQFTDENGNVINAKKIVLEKKKKEYPKNYFECCKVMDCAVRPYITADEPGVISYYEDDLNHKVLSFRKLLICRDAYWKIAGENMGLNKPWEPDYKKDRYIICKWVDEILTGYRASGFGERFILEFPTEEMRDAFYESFKEEIEICKELL